MGSKAGQPKAKINNILALKPYLKSYSKEIFFIIITLIATSAIILFLGKIVKYLIDFAFAAQNLSYLNNILLILAGAIVALAVIGYFRSFLVNSVGEKVITDLRQDIYAHIIKVAPQFFETTKTGDVISRLTVDTALLYSIISSSIAFALRNFLLFCGAIAFLFLTSAKLTLISLALIPLAIAPIVILGKKIKKLSAKTQEEMANVGAHIEESINGIKTVQSYLGEGLEIANFKNHLKNYLASSLDKLRLRSLMIALVIACAFGSIVVVLWFGGHLVLGGQISAGDLSSFIFYAILAATSLVSLSQIMGQLQTASGAAQRLFELLQIKSTILEKSDAKILEIGNKNKLELQNIAFGYPSRPQEQVLQNFNLTIKGQEKIAIVGESGSGKSTILQLLMRFYDVNNGQILLNDVDIKDLKIANLRQFFAYIAQNCFIFSGTVFDNIAYANKDLTKKQLAEIIDNNAALHFIKKLPQGVETFVGEKGIKLSGGERQRIAIARAIVKNAPILLLDEATSALDNENEALISDYIAKLSADKTLIIVAHRLSTIVNCDKIIFIKDGQIAQMGSHKELMAQDGIYKKMYEGKEVKNG
jgi:ATP-binding cassette, subfamily B, bacterial